MEKAILDYLEEFAHICGGFLEHLKMGSGHGVGVGNARRRIKSTREGSGVREKEEKWLRW
jgi:hypothetical protein